MSTSAPVYGVRYTPGSHLAARFPESLVWIGSLTEAVQVRAATVNAEDFEVVQDTAAGPQAVSSPGRNPRIDDPDGATP